MANARIYFAPVTKQGIIVGGEISHELLEQARAREERRRARAEVQAEAPNRR